MSKYLVFSIDNVSNPRVMGKFLHHMDVAQAMGMLKGKMVSCIGSYKGELEPSFLVTYEDFDDIVAPSGYCDGQESFLQVDVGHKGRQYASLLYVDTQLVPLGELKSVSKDKALKCEAWTYRLDTGEYFVTEGI